MPEMQPHHQAEPGSFPTTVQAQVRKYKTHTTREQRDQLIVDHLRFVRHILGKLIPNLPNNVDNDNLESAGVLGLVEAAQQFDPNRGVAFQTFAYSRIRGAILDELRRNSPLPQKMIQQATMVRKAIETLPQPVDSEVIAEQTGLSVDDVEKTLEAMRLARFQNWDDSAALLGGVLDGHADRPDELAEKSELQRLLAEAIAELPERERVIVTLYHLEDLRLKEIGEVVQLSESRVSRVLASAHLQLNQIVKAKGG